MICVLLARIVASFSYRKFKEEQYMNQLDVCIKTRNYKQNVIIIASFVYEKLEKEIIGFNQRAA